VNSSDTRVATYLDDLARMLSDLDPAERDEVLAGIREHLDAEIGSGQAGDAEVEAALLRLGPPEEVASEARRGGQSIHGMRDAAPRPSAPGALPDGAAWARVAVVLTLICTLPFLLLALWTRVAVTLRATGAGWPDGQGLFGANGVEVALLMALVSPLWIVALVCTLVAPGLTPRTRLRLALVGPAVFVATVIGAGWWSPGPLSGVVSVGLLAAAGTGALRISRVAWREARA
jgi:uncharacterized membrane protein